MNFNRSRANRLIVLIAISLCCESSLSVVRQEKGETLFGIVEFVDGTKITVNHRRESRAFTLEHKAKINYVSFLKSEKEIKPGFFIRAEVNSDGQCKQLWVTLPIPSQNLKPTSKMLAMTPMQLLKMADANGDGELSYVEYATAIYRSPKHGPVGFGKADVDKSGTLNLKEFASKLQSIKWYRISRKTPAQWHMEADANSDGVLNRQEFVTFLGSTAHLETFFKRADRDNSGDLSVEDLASFIDSILR